MKTARPIAVVTGGARRVGAAIAQALAQRGCDVLITYNASERDAKRTVAALRRTGVAAGAMPLDLGDEGDVEAAVGALREHLPRLDVLVHNASRYEPSPLGRITAAQLLADYRVHALGPLMLTQGLAPLLKKSRLAGGAAVVAMTDMHVLGRPRRDLASYAMSKAALVEMVRSLARDLAPRVRVNGVAPGVVAWPTSGPEAARAMQAAYLSRVPLERSGTPEDAAEVAAWLALEARYVTGEIVRVDGGRWLA